MQFSEPIHTHPHYDEEVPVYEAPAIIFEGSIGTRAGTPQPDVPDDSDSLFGD